ncbi:MAG: hypothetical protein J6334_06110, partial [Kiritimatiellae bacterium]|nr:hypothetical protein [Kiritimatiellia bacterium]
LLVLFIVALFVFICVMWMFQEMAICSSDSPDGRYVLVVMKRNIDSLPVMPGQGSDVKCFVELRRRVDGQIISRKTVDMLQKVEHIQWDADKVWINPRCAISYDGKAIGICQDSTEAQ